MVNVNVPVFVGVPETVPDREGVILVDRRLGQLAGWGDEPGRQRQRRFHQSRFHEGTLGWHQISGLQPAAQDVRKPFAELRGRVERLVLQPGVFLEICRYGDTALRVHGAVGQVRGCAFDQAGVTHELEVNAIGVRQGHKVRKHHGQPDIGVVFQGPQIMARVVSLPGARVSVHVIGAQYGGPLAWYLNSDEWLLPVMEGKCSLLLGSVGDDQKIHPKNLCTA